MPEIRVSLANAAAAAAARATTARDSADKVKGATQLPSYKEARAAEAAGRQAETTDPVAAGTHYLEAEKGYQNAAAERRAALVDEAIADRTLANQINTQMAQALAAQSQQKWDDALKIYRDVRRQAPQTPGIDALISEVERKGAEYALQQWASRQLTAAEQAIAREDWDEARRVVSDLRQRAPKTPNLDGLQSRLEQAIADSRRRTAATQVVEPPPPPKGPETPVKGTETKKEPDTPSKGSDEPVRKPQSPAGTDEKAAVRSVLDAFAQGYSRQSLSELQRAWPSMPSSAAETYQRSFKSHVRQNWQFDEVSIALEGATAVATCNVRIEQQGIRDKQPITEYRRYRITLKRGAAGWEVANLQFDGAR